MSRSNKTVSKPFCKVCFDSGKTESEYTSHYVRRTTDPKSEVLCPVLLGTECRYCHAFGHTLTRCPVRERNNANRQEPMNRRPEPVRQEPVKQEPVKQVTNKNLFALLEENDEEDDKVIIDHFPALGSRKPIVASVQPIKSFMDAFKSTELPTNHRWEKEVPIVVEAKKDYTHQKYECESDDEYDNYDDEYDNYDDEPSSARIEVAKVEQHSYTTDYRVPYYAEDDDW
jgi:hypothetical protein